MKMKKLIKNNVGLPIIFLIASRALYQPEGNITNHLFHIAFNGVLYFTLAYLFLYIYYTTKEITTKIVSLIVCLFHSFLLLVELSYIHRPIEYMSEINQPYWIGNIVIFGLIIIVIIVNKFTTLIRYGRLHFKKSGIIRRVFPVNSSDT